jgi:hypothetical protein
MERKTVSCRLYGAKSSVVGNSQVQADTVFSLRAGTELSATQSVH